MVPRGWLAWWLAAAAAAAATVAAAAGSGVCHTSVLRLHCFSCLVVSHARERLLQGTPVAAR
jgi:hypothetical protein